jgi:hypothetical protein
MYDEILRQFARKVARKDRPDRPRVPSPENLDALVKFLCLDAVDMLSKEELKDPEVPASLARLFSAFLRNGRGNDLSPSARKLNGSYRAFDRSFTSSKTPDRVFDLALWFDNSGYLARLSETVTLFTYSPGAKAGEFKGKQTMRREGEGWAILTPEDNLFIFMRNKKYGGNYYYFSIGSDSSLDSNEQISVLLLMRHENPVRIDHAPLSFDVLHEQSQGNTDLVCFKKIIGSSEST